MLTNMPGLYGGSQNPEDRMRLLLARYGGRRPQQQVAPAPQSVAGPGPQAANVTGSVGNVPLGPASPTTHIGDLNLLGNAASVDQLQPLYQGYTDALAAYRAAVASGDRNSPEAQRAQYALNEYKRAMEGMTSWGVDGSRGRGGLTSVADINQAIQGFTPVAFQAPDGRRRMPNGDLASLADRYGIRG